MPDPYEPRFHVVLHEPEIPYNTGSVGRTCVALGAKLWLIRPLGFQVDDYHLRRAGLDYWSHLAWEVVDHWAALQERLPGTRFWCFTTRAERAFTSPRYEPGDALLFGCESQGLPAEIVRDAGDRALRIPTRSAVRSLNLSNAVAVAGYELVRQWAVRGGGDAFLPEGPAGAPPDFPSGG